MSELTLDRTARRLVRPALTVLLVLSSLLMLNCDNPDAAAPYFEQLGAKQAAGDAPDVGYMDAFWMPEYVDAGRLVPIDDALVEDDFYPQVLAYVQRDGQTFVLPHDVATMALIVNATRLEEAGVAIPGNWEEFRWAAERLTDPERGVYGVGLTRALGNFAPYLYQAGGSLLDDSGTKLTLNTPQAHQALSFYVGLHLDGLALLVDGDWPQLGSYDALIESFAEGRVAMFVGGPRMYDIAAHLVGRDQVRAVDLPMGPGGKATLGEVRGLALFRPPSDETFALLKYASSAEGMMPWIREDSPADYVPARQSLRGAWLKARPDTEAFINGIEHMRPYLPARASVDQIAEFDRLAAEVLGQALREEISVEDALARLQEAGDAGLE